MSPSESPSLTCCQPIKRVNGGLSVLAGLVILSWNWNNNVNKASRQERRRKTERKRKRRIVRQHC